MTSSAGFAVQMGDGTDITLEVTLPLVPGLDDSTYGDNVVVTVPAAAGFSPTNIVSISGGSITAGSNSGICLDDSEK